MSRIQEERKRSPISVKHNAECDRLNEWAACQKEINQGKMALKTPVTDPGAKGLGQLL